MLNEQKIYFNLIVEVNVEQSNNTSGGKIEKLMNLSISDYLGYSVEKSLWNKFMEISVPISHLLVVFNCSINFIIYCCKDSKFRNILKAKLRRKRTLNQANSVQMTTLAPPVAPTPV